MSKVQTRRQILALVPSAAAALLASRRSQAAEWVLETTKIKLPRIPAICFAPQFIAEQLLLADGFTEVQYVDAPSSGGLSDAMFAGAVDFGVLVAPQLATAVDLGKAVTGLAPIHVGCLELIASDHIRTIADLKGKRVGVSGIGAGDYLFGAVTVAHIGLDPVRDITWIASDSPTPDELFIKGELDAVVGTPPVPQHLRAERRGHVLANSTLDYPWSQYFCCLWAGNRAFVRDHPVATKRVVRAILKATDLCSAQPAWAAKQLVSRNFVPQYDDALQTLNDVPYNNWRDYDPSDTIRFYALRMRELGFIQSTPQRVIAEGTDWRLFNELKRELKG